MASLAPQHLQFKAVCCFPIYGFGGVLEENRLDLQKLRKWEIKGYRKNMKKNEKDASSAILPCQDGKGQLAKFTWFKYQRPICLQKYSQASCHSLRATVFCPGVGITAMAAHRLTWTTHTSQCLNSDRSRHMATHSSSTCLALCCTGRLSSSVLTWRDRSEPRLCELFDVVHTSLQLSSLKCLLDRATDSQGLITLLALWVYWLLVCRRWPQVKSMTSPEASHFLALGCHRVMG